ncbi:UvrD-helicase domain-containing protein [Falsirhodobacter xinxiangensis]|uniref:UvrD-helicase domain-containing protein n=1 Tax=Falsirhodobacter xinxiangensis TaxID=2530049 RepID=UPI0010AAB71E|nr:UvrD-helicase domain-containing protein [Rhodobacter xinxiangensis]
MTLTIVPAGAGAGKTHRIKETLKTWVEAGEVRPDRILAVTFTEAAAGELRERIRASLLDAGMIDQALAVERAYVSTIHGLGLRVLTEHAFAAGASPQPRHLSDAERDLLIRQSLAHCDELGPVMKDPERFGYAASFGTGDTLEDGFRAKVLSTIDLLRGLGDSGTDPALIETACARVTEVYGATEADGAPLETALRDAAQAMLAMFPEGTTGTSDAAVKAFRDDLANLRAAAETNRLSRDWKLWGKLRALRQSKRGSPTPEGYDAHAEAVILAAERIVDHPGPHADAVLQLRCLIGGAQAIMASYAARKRALGVIDFADMIVEAERLLRTNEQVLDAVLAEVDCVIVDEFQDTNPVQFALLWRLASRAKRTLLVGDVKQSIMGFQGADPRLTQALVDAFPDNVDPLPKNWRSDPRIMGVVNHIGAGLFPHYTRLEPTRNETGQPFLEAIRIPDGRGSRTKPTPDHHIAARIRAILNDGDLITDRHDGTLRPARPSDIAVLVGRHSVAAKYAETLTAYGIPVRISGNGWAASRAIAAARHALALVADPADTHAALCLLTLGPSAADLQQALTNLTDGNLLDHPDLQPLLALAPLARTAPMAALVPQVLAASGLSEWADHLPDAAQSHADLLRLEHEAAEFDAAHPDMKAAAGFHGYSPKVFLGWLAAQSAKDFDRHPDPSSGSALGVEIVTWHASKGREWPITVVAELDRKIGEWPGTTVAEFADFSDLSRVLDTALILHTPKLDVPERLDRFLQARHAAAEAGMRNLLYVALTRARDRLILEWPDFAFKKEDPFAAGLLVAETGMEIGASLTIGGESFPLGSTATAVGEPEAPTAPVRFGTLGAATPPQTEWRQRPSQLGHTQPMPGAPAVLALGTAHLGDETFAAATEKGTAWHLAFRTLAMRPDLADRLNAATSLDAATLAAIAAQAQGLRDWLTREGFPELHAELPIQIDNPDGSQLNGVIDLLAIGPRGIVIVDHKTGGGGFAGYWPQLAAYADAASRALNLSVVKVAIHWMNNGTIEVLEMETANV